MVAYAIGGATPEKPFASKVIVRDLDSGTVVREFDRQLAGIRYRRIWSRRCI